MKAQLASILPVLAVAALAGGALATAACDGPGQPETGRGSTTPAYERVNEKALAPGAVPVRVGELGQNFPACYAMARFRDRVLAEGEAIAVRAAPFEQAREIGRIAADGQFFICTRSHDQRWFAIVWHEAEGASRSCGVSVPASVRRDYDGPCRSGWIPSAPVRLESGILHEVPTQANPSG
jgi:hypothetical protein